MSTFLAKKSSAVFLGRTEILPFCEFKTPPLNAPMKRQYTSKRNPCPICSNHHGCAIREDGLIECLRSFSQQDASAGYRFLALLRNDMGGLFALDDGSNSQTVIEGHWQGQRFGVNVKVKERYSVKERVDAKQLVAERHHSFRLITQQTTLSTRHSSHLQERRQLTVEEINWLCTHFWVRTWQPGIYAPNGVIAALPGISKEGKLLGMPGIAIAALDPDLKITGFQIATLRTDPKYIWLSSANQGGSGPQLPNGELPLFCWKHPDTKKVKVVILCEGALKSLLTALFLWRSGQTDIAVIGTASAARYGEKTLKNYLKRLRPKEIRLMPDAGAIANSHIASSNQETLQRCRQWGYRLTVGDWGQLDNKQHLDIDELLAAGRQNQIKLITSAAYFCQCHTYSQIGQLLKLGSFHLLEDKLIELRPLPDSTQSLDLIRQYATGVERCRKGGYRIVVAWNSETITPEDFFALCPESIQQQLAQSEREWALLYNLKLWLRRMVERYRPKKGFSEPIQEVAQTTTTTNKAKNQTVVDENKQSTVNNQQSDFVKYKPGKLHRLRKFDSRKILFKKGQRLQVLLEAIAAGWKHILDKSPTGTFKSYDAGKAIPAVFGVRQLWYFTSQVRNITTESVEQNYVTMQVRNDGMVFQSTPGGKKYLRWPKKGETPDTSGNCHRTKVFAALRDKNIPSVEGVENPVCANCHLLEACRFKEGFGFGYRNLRAKAIMCDRLRAHPDSAPDPVDYDWTSCGNFWDEVMQTVQPIHPVTVELPDIDRVMAELMIYCPQVNVQLQPMWMVLRQCLTGEIQEPHYGWNDSAIREMLGTPPDNLDEIIALATEFLHPDLESVLNTTSNYGVNLSDLPSGLRKRFGNKNSEVQEIIRQHVILNWFVPFLSVWSKQIQGALRIVNSQLIVTTRKSRHAEIAKASGWNIYLDATTTAEYLSWWMDINPEEILTIEQSVPVHNNLQIIQVTGLGQVSKYRTLYCQNRVDALRQELLVRHPDIKFIDFVKCCQSSDGGWFRDSRGSNEFKKVSTLATFGIPYQNIGDLSMLFLTLNKNIFTSGEDLPLTDSQEFQDFVRDRTQAEIIQAIGRLRADNRPQEQLCFYFCADYDLSFLEMKVENINAGNITISAASLDEKSWWKIQNAVKELWSQGRKITQASVESISGITQGYISKVVSKFSGNWKEWLKIFLSLLNTFNSNRNNSDESSDGLRDEAHSIGCNLMPLLADYDNADLLSEVFSWYRDLDNKYWQWILETTPVQVQGKIIVGLLSMLPKPWHQELMELCYG